MIIKVLKMVKAAGESTFEASGGGVWRKDYPYGVTIHHATKLPAAIEDEVSIVIRDKTVLIKTTGNKKITLQ